MPNTQQQSKVKHPKKRNIGLVFELLTTQLTKAILEGDSSQSSSIMKILKQHYGSKRSAIYQENRYYDAIISTRCNNDANASRIVEAVVRSHVSTKDGEKLEKARQLLVRNISESLGAGFWKYPINGALYKAYASAYKILNYHDNESLTLESTLDITKSKAYLIEYLTTAPTYEEAASQLISETLHPKEGEVVEELLLVKYYQLYNDAYKDALNENQQVALTAFYSFLNNKNIETFEKKVNEMREGLKVRLMKERNYINGIKDEDVRSKFFEALNKFDNDVLYHAINESTSEDIIKNVLLYEELAKEINNHKDKK